MVKSDSFHLETAGLTDILDITDKVNGCVRASKIAAGLVNISVPGSTAGLTTIEYESGVIEDSGKILLGTWKQIVLIDFDNRPRKREVIVQMVGD